MKAGAGQHAAKLGSTLSVPTEECREARHRGGEEQELKFAGARGLRDTSP